MVRGTGSSLERGSRRRRLRRRFRDLSHVPVLPSMVTLGNLFFGFLAMAKATDAVILQGSGNVLTPEVLALFETAALLVFLAMVFDGLDGAVARLTNQATAFGTQLDSLADVVTFGVAPAFIAKLLVDFHARPDVALLPHRAKLYWAAAAIYVLCAAMRLARYNVEASAHDDEDERRDDDSRDFAGMPTPGAAAVVCSLIAFFTTTDDDKVLVSGWLLGPTAHHLLYDGVVVAMPLVLVLLGLLMVSRVPYPHLVAAVVRGRHSFPFLATLVVLVFLAAIEWQFALAALSISYVVLGPVIGVWRLVTRGRMTAPAPAGVLDDDEDDDDVDVDAAYNGSHRH